MILDQYYLGCLAQAAYLIGDEKTGRAVVVDPRRDVQEFLDDASALGLEIRDVFLTHFHADFVAGHLELQQKTGASIRLGAQAQADFDFLPMRDGDEMELGSVRLRVLETPGHTPESICILVYDRETDPEQPVAVLTGDTLFIGDVGRPDLTASEGLTAADLAGRLYDSLRNKLLPLPDRTLVYPGHGAGSMCGKNMSSETVSTIGDQRRFNYALQPMSKEAFVQLVTADQPEAPAYFAHDADLNRRQRSLLDQNLESALCPMTLEAVAREQVRGAALLDVRDPDDYAALHLPGSINIGLSGNYAVWAGTFLDREKPIIVLAPPGREEEAVLRLGRIGLDRVIGFLEDGPDGLARVPPHARSTPRLTPWELERVRSTVYLLDIRSDQERAATSIPGSAHIPLNRLLQRQDEIPREEPVVIYCRGGYRSSIAASLLRNQGHPDVRDLSGGINAWLEAQREVA